MITRASGRHDRAVTTVASVDRPSTTITSSTRSGMFSRTHGMLAASFLVGMIKLTTEWALDAAGAGGAGSAAWSAGTAISPPGGTMFDDGTPRPVSSGLMTGLIMLLTDA